MRYGHKFFVLGVVLVILGCSTAAKPPENSLLNRDTQKESAQDAVTAVGAVAGAMSGQELTDKDLQDVAQQVRKDPEARSALEAITGSLGTTPSAGKYCPVDGARFDGQFTRCPQHNVELNEITE